MAVVHGMLDVYGLERDHGAVLLRQLLWAEKIGELNLVLLDHRVGIDVDLDQPS